MRVCDGKDMREVRAFIRAHGFWQSLGLGTDLVLIDTSANGYDRPVRDRLENLIAAGHLNRMRCVPGGGWLLDGATLNGEQRQALIRFASATFTAGMDFNVQVRRLLKAAQTTEKRKMPPMKAGENRLPPLPRLANNGYGGFADDGYAIDVLPNRLPPAPWCNILANEAGGMLLSERGGGFFWQGNSRGGRLTPYGNDALWEDWGLTLC
jgi:cyclic beta-1,2-glucan synthetase